MPPRDVLITAFWMSILIVPQHGAVPSSPSHTTALCRLRLLSLVDLWSEESHMHFAPLQGTVLQQESAPLPWRLLRMTHATKSSPDIVLTPGLLKPSQGQAWSLVFVF
ncbi:hypothetical protein AC578_8306 [Pseudocercospora eumusae]|uniref:Secreted protein n=1 Tax=Pseudocercospora eumusae TaxID=321146 RepID=A0A139H2Y2_9PEZI|nr:hypothetical protein AC578_8306 [Pseudocercospora eumusae]